MKKRIPTFVAGMLTTTLIGSIGVTALAARGQVSFNLSPIQFNGKTISAAGEDFALENGQKVPASITYTDEQGGGTTYLPARRIAELMDVDIGYDAATGSVAVSGDAVPAPDDTPLPTYYSDWSAEEEAAYQEFKGMWEVKDLISENSRGWHDYHAIYVGIASKEEFMNYWNTDIDTISKLGQRFITEVRSRVDSLLWFNYQDVCIGQAVIYPNGNAYCSMYPIT